MILLSVRRVQLGIAVVTALALVAFGAAAQAPPVVVDPAIVDFGKVPPGSKHPATFLITNAGPAPLTVKSVVPSCKCTGVNALAGTVIAPGSSATLLATLDVPTTPGEKDAKVFVTFEGYPQPVMALLKADASLPIRVTPAYLDALKGVASGTVALASQDGTPFTVVSAGGVAPVFEGFAPATDSPRSSYTLRWTAPTTPCESMPLWWVVETDRPDCPLIPLRIRHECTGLKADPTMTERFWFFPEPIGVAGRLAVGQSAEVPIVIEHMNKKGRGAIVRADWAAVKAVRSLSPLMTAELVGQRPGSKDDVALILKVAPTALAKGIVYGLVEVETATGKGSFAIVMQVPDVQRNG